MAHEQRIADANQRAAILTRIAEGYKVKNVVVSTDVTTALDTLNSDDEDDDDLGDDDAFMREFREKRLRGVHSYLYLIYFKIWLRNEEHVYSAHFWSHARCEQRRLCVRGGAGGSESVCGGPLV